MRKKEVKIIGSVHLNCVATWHGKPNNTTLGTYHIDDIDKSHDCRSG